jgi:hypothetical protein
MADMKTLRSALIAACAAVPATAALADPTTYKGKLGSIDVLVELSADPSKESGPIAGRYVYMNKGVDIPLQAASRDGRTFTLAEEEPCGQDKCGDGQAAPTGAVWTLKAGENGKLTGTWKGKRELKLDLVRAGSRFEPTAPKTPLDLYLHSEGLAWGEDPITLASEPYDYLRLDVPLQHGRAEGWADAKFNYAVDPRTVLAVPRVVELAGGVPVEAANARLQARHWRRNLSGFNCAALQYVGLNENGPDWATEGGSLGGIDEMSTEVKALTPKLMSWQESGSLYCGGAHPFNFITSYVMEVATGAELSLADMFADVADGKPGETLAAFVRDIRRKPVKDFEIEFEEECGTDELIGEYLAASLRREGDEVRIVFGLEGLPHVINACGDDLLELPAAEAKHLLTPRFAGLLGL